MKITLLALSLLLGAHQNTRIADAFTAAPPNSLQRGAVVTSSNHQRIRVLLFAGDGNPPPFPSPVPKPDDKRPQKGSAASGGAGLIFSHVKSVANTTTSGVKSAADAAAQFVDKTSSNVKSAASATGTGVKSAADKVASGFSHIVGKGQSDVKSATTGLARQGGSIVQWLEEQAKGTATVAWDTAGAANKQAQAAAKELVRIAKAGADNYSLSDVMLLLKILLAVGASFGPVAELLPVAMLLEMLNVSLEARLGGKILEVLAGALDERFVTALKSEELGDLAKRSLTGAILSFTGKQTYKEGDIERAVAGSEGATTTAAPVQKTLDLSVGRELAQWDESFRESHNPGVEQAVAESMAEGQKPKALDRQTVDDLEEWDRIFRNYGQAGHQH